MDTLVVTENGTTFITPNIQDLPSLSHPLTAKKSLNSLNAGKSPSVSPSRKPSSSPTRRKRIMVSVPATTASSAAFADLQDDYTALEAQYAELLVKNSALANEHSHLLLELKARAKAVSDQAQKLAHYEHTIRTTEKEYLQNKELLEKEVYFYKELAEDLHLKLDRANADITNNTYLNDSADSSATAEPTSTEDLEKYNRLLKDFRILQSNFELEQNSKLVLIDQIEYLTKEVELRTAETSPTDIHNLSNNSDENLDLEYYDQGIINNISNPYIHTMNDLSEEDSDADASMNDTQLLSYLVDEHKLESSSPIKGLRETSDESIDVSRNFQFPPPANVYQFPPSPDPATKAQKRSSLPLILKASPALDQDEFVLSPLKLTSGNPNGSYFDGDTSITKTKKRYSSSKPTHSRYNSHDIVPIKVEFEPQDLTMRSTSVPEKEHQKFDIISEEEQPRSRKSVRNSAFLALNGQGNLPSNRNSVMYSTTNTSSKRSSLAADSSHINGVNANDVTKQELMKLKFELQSLKLHNEKLLSYIGFELQKQSKNIKKLSHKQSLNSLNKNGKRMEYSDAKLIQKSRDMLINKKRVLRSVSINPILSKKYGSGGREHQLAFFNTSGRPLGIGILTNGLLPYTNEVVLLEFANEERMPFSSDFLKQLEQETDEDDYGFLKHNDRFGQRIFSSGVNNYLNYDELDAENDSDFETSHKRTQSKGLKKFQSQTFRINKTYLSSEDDDSEYGDEWEDVSYVVPEVPQYSVFNQMKQLLFGTTLAENKIAKSDKNRPLTDDGLKYKFLTIAIGIMIIGIRCTTYQHQASATN